MVRTRSKVFLNDSKLQRESKIIHEERHAISYTNRDPTNYWIRSTSLTWKTWKMKPRLWMVSTRRRLHMPASPRKTMCIACKKGRVDKQGEHQVMCAGRGGLIMRHDSIRDLLMQQLEKCGYAVQIEKNAGSPDRSKPGDLKISR